MLLGIDVGTQNAKALVYDVDQCRVIDIPSSSLRLITAPDGARAQLAQWWLAELGKGPCWLYGYRQAWAPSGQRLRSTVRFCSISGGLRELGVGIKKTAALQQLSVRTRRAF